MAIMTIWTGGVQYAFYPFLLLLLYIGLEDLKQVGLIVVMKWKNQKYLSAIIVVLFIVVIAIVAVLGMAVAAVLWPITVWIMLWRTYRTFRGRRAKKRCQQA